MLRNFLITNDSQDDESRYAVLHYDTDTDKYSMDIPENAVFGSLPAIPWELHKMGKTFTDDHWARRWVKERIIPPDRQNIGYILRKIGVSHYTEFAILEYLGGHSCMDDFYLKEIK